MLKSDSKAGKYMFPCMTSLSVYVMDVTADLGIFFKGTVKGALDVCCSLWREGGREAEKE